MTDTAKIAIARLVSSTAPVGTVSGTVGPYEVAITADGSDPIINTLPGGTAVYGGKYLASEALIEATTLASAAAARTGAADSTFTGPTIPSGTTALTVALDAFALPYGSNSLATLWKWASNTFGVYIDNREGARGFRVIFGDANESSPFGGLTYTSEDALTDGPHDLVVSVSHDDGTGRARWAAFVDGVSIGSGDTASSAAPTFATTRTLQMLNTGYAIDGIGRVRVFGGTHAEGYTSDGDVSGLTLLAAESEMSADQFNTGTAYFTPVGADWTVVGSSSPDPVEPDEPSTPPPDATLSSQTAEFGEGTRTTSSGGYGYQIVDDAGNPVTGASLTGGTATGVAISSSGVLSATSDGALSGQHATTAQFSCDQGTGTCTLSVIADAESVGTFAGFQTACDAAVVADGGKTIFVPKMLDTSSVRQFEPASKTAKAINPIIVRSAVVDVMTGGFTHGLTLRHASNFKLRWLDLHDQRGVTHDSNGFQTAVLALNGDCLNTDVQDCHIHSVYRDPLGDYTAPGSYQNATDGITTGKTSFGSPGRLTLERCKIYDVKNAGTVTFDKAGGFIVRDCEIKNIYSDAFNVVGLADAKNGPWVAERNLVWYFAGSPADEDNPHIDPLFQFVSASNTDGDEIHGLTMRQNIMVEIDAARGRYTHGVATSFTDGGARVTMVDPIIEHNIVLTTGNHHLTLRCNGGTFRHNTFAVPSAEWGAVETPNPDPTKSPFKHKASRFDLELMGDKPVLIENNITETSPAIYGPNSGTAPVTQTNNYYLGLNYSTTPMGDIFQSSAVEGARSFQEIIDGLTPISGGPADGTNLGAIVPGVTYAEPMDPTGWALP